MSEISWSAGADVHATSDVRIGGRFSGGIPVGAQGDTRVVGAARVGWHTGRVVSAAEIEKMTGLRFFEKVPAEIIGPLKKKLDRGVD